MYLDESNNIVDEKQVEDRDGELFQKAIMLVDSIREISGKSPKSIIDRILETEESFSGNSKLKKQLYAHYSLWQINQFLTVCFRKSS